MTEYLLFSILLLLAGTFSGIVICRYRLFPYQNIIRILKNWKKKTDGPWSIGIYEGLSPFELIDPPDVNNPVITAKDVVDLDASFVADPFMVFNNGLYTMFLEALNRETEKGVICYAESADGKSWEYRKVIIDETFHLSYPYVFKWKDNFYLIPESYEDFSVRLYQAVKFPDDWKYLGNLLSGYPYIDPSIFRHNNKWWLFVSTLSNDVLNLYYSDDLLGEWKPHPMNPVVKLNSHIARPGGRVISHNGKLFRFAQDCFPSYGIQIFAFEITELTEKIYSDKTVSENPIIGSSGKGWNKAGMHQLDLHQIGEKWIAAVDGRDK